MTKETQTLHDKLASIQLSLKAPKSNRNSFGNYNYRSCEDILEAVKPLLDGATLVIDDDLVNVGQRYYVKATAALSFGGELVTATAFAREPETKKGMDEAQITGATSSYARKYALNGLFAIDDTRDADSMDNRQTDKPKVYKDPDEPWVRERVDQDVEASLLDVPKTLACDTCGQPAQEKTGVSKTGKPWHGIFCTSDDRSHTKWL